MTERLSCFEAPTCYFACRLLHTQPNVIVTLRRTTVSGKAANVLFGKARRVLPFACMDHRQEVLLIICDTDFNPVIDNAISTAVVAIGGTGTGAVYR